MTKNFFITTPIYYPSGKPHMGHAYSSILTDIIARFKRLEGYEVFFLTGTDEHGLKIQKSAEKVNKNPIDFCNEVSEVFRNLSNQLNLSNSDFIRTTEDRHKKVVQQLWGILSKKDQIYLSKYSGWYSISDEAYYTEEEVFEEDGKKKSITSGSEVEWMEEESYFFKLSDFEKKLLSFYEKNPDFVQPESRKNEVVSFIKQGLKDLSVSRTTFNWGISVPGHKKHVIYVWLDALVNYVSASNYFNKDQQAPWPTDIHVIGKDILRFHAVYWPAFLMAADLPLPKKIFSHGWILSGDEKMSKSKGNILDPIELINEYGVDEIRYYLAKEVVFGLDGKINKDNIEICINDLANNIGNLTQRVFTLIEKYYDLKMPNTSDNYTKNSMTIIDSKNFVQYLRNLEIHNYIKEINKYSSKINKYVNDNEPWNRKLNSDTNIKNILNTSINSIKNIFILLHPIMPKKSEYFLNLLGLKSFSISNLKIDIPEEQKLSKPKILFKKY
tara:strand:- start:44515 stop:46008 length:1494 start_codon:yes stop_codon:yes gene_type:complete